MQFSVRVVEGWAFAIPNGLHQNSVGVVGMNSHNVQGVPTHGSVWKLASLVSADSTSRLVQTMDGNVAVVMSFLSSVSLESIIIGARLLVV